MRRLTAAPTSLCLRLLANASAQSSRRVCSGTHEVRALLPLLIHLGVVPIPRTRRRFSPVSRFPRPWTRLWGAFLRVCLSRWVSHLCAAPGLRRERRSTGGRWVERRRVGVRVRRRPINRRVDRWLSRSDDGLRRLAVSSDDAEPAAPSFRPCPGAFFLFARSERRRKHATRQSNPIRLGAYTVDVSVRSCTSRSTPSHGMVPNAETDR